MTTTFEVGTRVRVVGGHRTGRTGIVVKAPGALFPEYCYVDLDMTPRERVQKRNEFLKLEDIEKQGPTLNEELARLGMTKSPTKHGMYEVRRADGSILCEGRAHAVWFALQGEKEAKK